MGGPRRLPGVVLVDARRAYDGEPAQHVARRRAERDHREAAHDARLRARAPHHLALEAQLAVVLLRHALGDTLDELHEPVVELAEVAEDEGVHDAELREEVGLTAAHPVGQVVVAARALASYLGGLGIRFRSFGVRERGMRLCEAQRTEFHQKC